jgi:hypothetical protein
VIKNYFGEIVWASYFNRSQGKVYLEYTPDTNAIRGLEIYKDDQVRIIHYWNHADVKPGPRDEC